MKRTVQDESAINRMLRSHGLPGLEAGNGLMAALGFLVKDHEHLRSLIARCEPEHRSAMFNSLKPYLNFEAHPLDWYIARSAERAEARQLPTIDPEGGDYIWPSDARATGLCVCESIAGVYLEDATPCCKRCRRPIPAERMELAGAQEAVNQAHSKHSLRITCRSCTKQQEFAGLTRADAIRTARLEGWVYYEREIDGKSVAVEICPECPAIRREVS